MLIHRGLKLDGAIGQGKICNSLKTEIFSKSFLSHIGKNKINFRKKKFWLSRVKDLLGTKVMYCYVVKWPLFRLQRGSAKSPIAPSNFSPLWVRLGYSLIILYFYSSLLKNASKKIRQQYIHENSPKESPWKFTESVQENSTTHIK